MNRRGFLRGLATAALATAARAYAPAALAQPKLVRAELDVRGVFFVQGDNDLTRAYGEPGEVKWLDCAPRMVPWSRNEEDFRKALKAFHGFKDGNGEQVNE